MESKNINLKKSSHSFIQEKIKREMREYDDEQLKIFGHIDLESRKRYKAVVTRCAVNEFRPPSLPMSSSKRIELERKQARYYHTLPRAGVRDISRPSQIQKKWLGSQIEKQRELERQRALEELKKERLKKILKWLLIIGISIFLLFILIDADIQLINLKNYS